MGLFGKLGGNKEIELTPQGGLLVAALTMVGIDGDIDEDEIAIIRRLDGSRATPDWDSALKVYKMKPISECVGIVANTLNEKQQLITIANLVDIAMADGILAGEEEQLLEAYVEAFDVPVGDIENIVNVISIKNDKSPFN